MGKYKHLTSKQINTLHSNLYQMITGDKFGDSRKDEYVIVGKFLGIKPDRIKQIVRGYGLANGVKRPLPPGRAIDAYLRHTIMHYALVGAGLLSGADFINRYDAMHRYFLKYREPYHEVILMLEDGIRENGKFSTQDIIAMTGLEPRTYYTIRKGRTSQGATTGGMPALHLLYSLYLLHLWVRQFKSLPDLSQTTDWNG